MKENVWYPALPNAAIKEISDTVHFYRQPFKLAGLVSHVDAGSDSGHFILHVKREKGWFTFDDMKKRVTSIKTTNTLAIAALIYVQGIGGRN